MGDNEIRSVVQQIVAEVAGSHVKALCSEVVDKVSARLSGAGTAGVPHPAGAPSSDLLNAAINSVQDHTSQSEILSALLEGCGKFSERTALFVLRSGNASGWRARGFANNDAIKSVLIDGNEGLVSRAIYGRRAVSAAAAEFNSGFLQAMGAPAEGANVIVLPLVVREKVAALVYADVGDTLQGKLDASALEVLVRCSSLWIEVIAARKAGTPAEVPPLTQTVSMAAAAAASAAPAPAPAVAPPPAPRPESAPVVAAPAAAVEAARSPEPESVAASAPMSAEDEEVHKKAKRFAKLLVDEIKLYNKKKVEQGRSSHNLYTLLKDDIEKSRATYDKRYGQTAAASADYFNGELVRVLAEGDKTLLGSGFSG
ncbi:MAG TPA: hypothetical protein VFU76_17890 [Terriglobales bacterium]|nr:hypothetical protein [Terriglobales bacterium]